MHGRFPGPLSVLLIYNGRHDDHPVRQHLQESDVDVNLRGEASLPAGLDALSAADWDAILTDVERLSNDPIGIVRRCNDAGAEGPVIVLAGPTTLHAAEASLQSGAAEVVRNDRLTPALLAHLLRWATEHTRTQQHLYQREAWLRSVTKQISDGLFRSTPDGEIVYASPSFVDLLGYETEEALSRTRPDALYADPKERDRLLQTVHDQGEASELSITFRCADGTPNRTLVSCTHIQGKEGAVEYLDGVVTTAPVPSPRTQHLQLYRDALDHSYIPAMILDAQSFNRSGAPDPRIAYANEALALMCGCDAEALHEQPLRRVISSPADAQTDLLSTLANGTPWSGRLHTVCANNAPIPASWFFTPLRNEAGALEYWLGVQHAPSDGRVPSSNQEKTQTTEDATSLKTAVLHNLSHEMRTPLTSINGFSQILKEELAPPHSHIADRIQHDSKRLQETIDSVLRLSRLETTDVSLDRTSVDLRSVVQTVHTRLHPKLEQEAIDFSFDRPSTPITAHASRGAVTRIVTNLLDNAVKFTPEGGRVALRVYQSRNASSEAVIEIEDTGIGIDEEFLPVLFDSFTQESQGLSREYDGLGLGLAIVHQLVDLLNGTIDVTTEKGTGTCVIVRLPAHAHADSSAAR